MANICEITDFTGELSLSVDDFTRVKFDSFRDEYQVTAIYNLLGVELGKLFLADLDVSGVPVTAKYLTIYNALAFEENGCNFVSLGIKDYVKRMVYFNFVRNNSVRVTMGGNTGVRAENGTNLIDGMFVTLAYNKGIRSAHAIQLYVDNNLSEYPEYNGNYINYDSYL